MDEEKKETEATNGVNSDEAKTAESSGTEGAVKDTSEAKAENTGDTANADGKANTADAANAGKSEAKSEGDKHKDKKHDKQSKRERELEEKLAETTDKYMRLAAEYDNFRKRSAKEREGIYGDAYADALGKLLPLLDNLDRASQYTDPEKLADGVKLILKNVPDALTSLGVEQFGESGDEFDPTKHSAVMMVEDAECEPGKIVAVLQRGYRRGDKVLRYAAVTVAGEK